MHKFAPHNLIKNAAILFVVVLSVAPLPQAAFAASSWEQCYADSGRRCVHPYVKVGYKCCKQSKSAKTIGYECVKKCDGNRNFNLCVSSCKAKRGAPVFEVR